MTAEYYAWGTDGFNDAVLGANVPEKDAEHTDLLHGIAVKFADGKTTYTYKFLQQYSRLIGKASTSSGDVFTANSRKIARAISKKQAAPPLRFQKPSAAASSSPQPKGLHKPQAFDFKSAAAAAAAAAAATAGSGCAEVSGVKASVPAVTRDLKRIRIAEPASTKSSAAGSCLLSNASRGAPAQGGISCDISCDISTAAPPRQRQQLNKSSWIPTDTLERSPTVTPCLNLRSTSSDFQDPCATILKGTALAGSNSSRSSSSRGSMEQLVSSGISASAPLSLSESESESENQSEMMLMMVDCNQQELESCGMALKSTTGYTTGSWQSSPGSDMDSSMGSAAGQTQAGLQQSCPDSPSSDSDSLLLSGVKGICSMEVDEGGSSEGTEDFLGRMFEEFRQDNGPEAEEGADSTWGLSDTPLDFLLVATLNPTWEGTVEEELLKLAHTCAY